MAAELERQDLERLERTALLLADVARPIARRHFRQRLSVEAKADASPVTVADREVEAAMRAELARLHPEHGVFGEEEGSSALDAEVVWVLDPIDGTRAFVTGIPLFGTLIAAVAKGVPQVGVVEVPALKERYTGVRGRGAYSWPGVGLRASGCTDVGAAAALLGPHSPITDEDRAGFLRLRKRLRTHRTAADCYGYAMVAAGHADAAVEVGLQPYDFLALVPVIEGAGGTITGWDGQPLTLKSDGRVVAAATPELHAGVLEVLRG